MDLIDNIFFINLESRIDRYKYFMENYKKYFNKNLIRINAIDGKNHKYSLNEIKLLSKADWNIYEKPGVQGCFFSHLFIIDHIIKNNLQISLILEDDIQFTDPENLNTDLKNIIENLPKDWEIVFTGHSILGHNLTEKINEYIYKTNVNHCTHCYIISLEGAKNIYKHILNVGIYRAIDNFYNDYLIFKNIFYTSTKSLGIQNNRYESNIQDKNNKIYGFKI